MVWELQLAILFPQQHFILCQPLLCTVLDLGYWLFIIPLFSHQAQGCQQGCLLPHDSRWQCWQLNSQQDINLTLIALFQKNIKLNGIPFPHLPSFFNYQTVGKKQNKAKAKKLSNTEVPYSSGTLIDIYFQNKQVKFFTQRASLILYIMEEFFPVK